MVEEQVRIKRLYKTGLLEMFIKAQLILVALISVVFSQTDDEESFLFVTKQTANRFIVQDKELTIKYGLYNSGPT